MASLFALVAALVWPAVSSQHLNLTILPQAFSDSFGAACLDGSPPSIYSMVQDTSRWLLFLEGGGWCFDTTVNGTIENCAGRASGGGGSSRFQGQTTDVGGMMSPNTTVNPRFAGYSLVFVHYCDGASMSSNASAPIPVPADVRERLTAKGVKAPAQIFMRGRPNLAAVLGYLRQNMGMGSSPAEVLVSGGSAGATAAYLSLDWIRDQFPSSTKVAGVPDAGFFLDGNNTATHTTTYRDDFIGGDPVWNTSGSGGLNADCVAAHAPSNTTWKCFLQQYAAQFIKTPFFVSNSAYDMWQVLNDLGLPCVPSTNGQPVSGIASCSPAQLSLMNNYYMLFTQQLNSLLVTYPGTGAWVPSCFVHEMNVEYCSTQSLPNCRGWGSAHYMGPSGQGNYTIKWAPSGSSAGAWNLDSSFSLWYDSVVADTAGYSAVMAARSAYRDMVVLPALDLAREQGSRDAVSLRAWAALAAGDAEVAQLDAALPAPVQVVDPVPFPGNPTCPFPYTSR